MQVCIVRLWYDSGVIALLLINTSVHCVNCSLHEGFVTLLIQTISFPVHQSQTNKSENRKERGKKKLITLLYH